jgi:hypothetical protein
MRDVEKLEPFTDVFTHFHLVQKTMNTRTQYMSANITVPTQEQFLSARHIHIDTVIDYHKSYTPERHSRFFPSFVYY